MRDVRRLEHPHYGDRGERKLPHGLASPSGVVLKRFARFGQFHRLDGLLPVRTPVLSVLPMGIGFGAGLGAGCFGMTHSPCGVALENLRENLVGRSIPQSAHLVQDPSDEPAIRYEPG